MIQVLVWHTDGLASFRKSRWFLSYPLALPVYTAEILDFGSDKSLVSE